MPGKTIGHLLPTRLPWIWRGLHGTMGHPLLTVSILEDGVYPIFTRSPRVCVCEVFARIHDIDPIDLHMMFRQCLHSMWY